MILEYITIILLVGLLALGAFFGAYLSSLPDVSKLGKEASPKDGDRN